MVSGWMGRRIRLRVRMVQKLDWRLHSPFLTVTLPLIHTFVMASEAF